MKKPYFILSVFVLSGCANTPDDSAYKVAIVWAQDNKMCSDRNENNNTASVKGFHQTLRPRVPPKYPGHCSKYKNSNDVVAVEFDVTLFGSTRNTSIVSSKNNCLNKTVIDAVKTWKYKRIGRERCGLEFKITFELSSL